jgi:hypothetical protein
MLQAMRIHQGLQPIDTNRNSTDDRRVWLDGNFIHNVTATKSLIYGVCGAWVETRGEVQLNAYKADWGNGSAIGGIRPPIRGETA